MNDIVFITDIMFFIICLSVVSLGENENKGKWYLIAIGLCGCGILIEHLLYYFFI